MVLILVKIQLNIHSSDGVSRINYTYITSNKFCGDMAELKILREGKEMEVKVTVDIIDYLGMSYLQEFSHNFCLVQLYFIFFLCFCVYLFTYSVPIVLYDRPVTYYIFEICIFTVITTVFTK